MSMKVLFIGGTGLISTAVSRFLLEKGCELTLLNRGSNREFEKLGARYLICDIGDSEAVRAAVSGLCFDSVVNWIAYTPDDVARDFELFRGMTGQYIFISSASAYQKPLSHYLITESTPLVNPYWEYSRNKAACEEYLFERYRTDGFPVTVVRPSHTYGGSKMIVPLSGAKTSWTYARRMLDGKETVVQGDGKSLWVVTHNTDFARGFSGLIGNFHAIGHAFHITSDEVLTWDQIITIQAAILGVEPNIVHIPSDFIAELLPEYGGALLGDKAESVVFVNTKIKTFVPGFVCETPFSVGARMILEELLSRPELHVVDEAYNDKIDFLVGKYRRK
jgi:nucleoside-diphosphate-sugar epimerase